MTTLPSSFVLRMQRQLGDDWPLFEQSLQTPAPVSIRVNTAKPAETFLTEDVIEWCDTGKYLKARPYFTHDPLLHAGAYYVQEASSMYLEQAWKTINPNGNSLQVLDLCAAPGGKSTHLLALMEGKGVLVSNELIPNRNAILRENIAKWGMANSIVTQNTPDQCSNFKNVFDVVVVDAPCSGEGLFRKDKNAVSEWSEKNVETCALRQTDILQAAMQCVKPGGYLVYSTCTYEVAENDEQVERSGAIVHSLPIVTDGIVRTVHGLQFYPHKVKGEGFYMALLQKPAVEHEIGYTTIKPVRTATIPVFADKYLQSPDQFIYLHKAGKHYAIPAHAATLYGQLAQQLYIRQAGILLGETKGEDFIPDHELALSIFLKKDVPSVEVDESTAIKYLRCETIRLETDIKGWCVIKFRQHPLGWVKINQGRVNNYYPKNWRILR